MISQKNTYRYFRYAAEIPISEHKLYAFLDLCGFTGKSAQIVKLRATDFTLSYDLYLFNIGRMNRESLFNAYAVGNTSYGEGFGNATVFLSDNGAFENLNSFSCTLFNSVVNRNGVTDIDYGYLLFELLVCESFNKIHKAPPSFFRKAGSVHAEQRQRTAPFFLSK